MSHLENPTKTDVFVDIGQLGVASEEVVSQFRLDIERGKHWFDALLDAIGSWGITEENINGVHYKYCLLYTSPSPRDATLSRMPSSA